MEPKDTDWLNGYKKDPYIYIYIYIYMCCLQEPHFRPRDTYRRKERGWKDMVHANGNEKKIEVAILISDTRDFKIKIL